MKNTNNAKTRVYREISDQIYQTINYVFNGALGNLYRVIFERAFEKMPFFTVTFILSLLKITTAQYKIYAVDLSKKEFEQHAKFTFIQDLTKRLTKALENNCYETFTEDVPEAEKKQCEKLTRDFIKKLDSKLQKMLAPKKVKTSDEKQVQQVQEVQEVQEAQEVQQEVIATSEEQKVVEVENLPFEQTPEGIGMFKELAKDLYNYTLIGDIKKKMKLSWVTPDRVIRELAMPYVEVKEEPKQESLYEETPENIELLKRLAKYRMDYIYKKGSLGGKHSDELLVELTKKWNMKDVDIIKLSEPYFNQYEEEYKQQQEEERAERERAEKERQAMLLKRNEVCMLNFAVSILIKHKKDIQFNLGQTYEADYMEFTEKQIAINNYKVDLNETQDLITKILDFRNGGYTPQYYTSAYDNEEDKQIASEAWTNFLAKDVYNPENKEQAIANLKLIFSKLRKF